MNFARLAVAAAVAAAISPASVAAADRKLSADRFEVRIVLARDGSMHVLETVTFRLEGGPFTSLTRVLPTRNTDGIADVAASLDGVPLPSGRQPGQVQIRREDGITVTWRFAPAFDTTLTTTLGYRVRGVVRRSALSDILVWRAVPARRSYAVRDASVRIEWPEGGTLSGWLNSPPMPDINAAGRDAITLALVRGLDPDTPFDVTLDFAPGTVTAATPAWQARRERGLAAAPSLAIAAGAILFSGLCWLGVFFVGHRRELPSAGHDLRVTSPPDALPAALAGALVEAGARPTWNHALATLVDLAGRGIVRIEEESRRTWQGTREYVIQHVGGSTGLAAHEAGLLDLLFVSKNGSVGSVKMSTVARAVQSRFKVFTLPLGDALVTAGLVDPERIQTRAALVRWGIVFIVVAGLGFATAVPFVSGYGGWPLLVPGSILAVALMLLVTASQYSVLSTAGSLRAVHWQAFFAFVRQLATRHAATVDPSWFDRYLPYAVARGIGHRWVRAFEKGGGAVAAPAWFATAESPHGSRTPGQSLADMLATARVAGAPKHAGA